MMKTHAILIDPKEETVTEIVLEGELLHALYKAIGCEMVECPINLPNGDTLVIDEEGMFKPKLYFFDLLVVPRPLNPIAGKAVILGSTPDGDWASCRSRLRDILPLVKLLDAKQAQQKFKDVKAHMAEIEKAYKAKGIQFIDAGVYPDFEGDT